MPIPNFGQKVNSASVMLLSGQAAVSFPRPRAAERVGRLCPAASAREEGPCRGPSCPRGPPFGGGDKALAGADEGAGRRDRRRARPHPGPKGSDPSASARQGPAAEPPARRSPGRQAVRPSEAKAEGRGPGRRRPGRAGKSAASCRRRSRPTPTHDALGHSGRPRLRARAPGRRRRRLPPRGPRSPSLSPGLPPPPPPPLQLRRRSRRRRRRHVRCVARRAPSAAQPGKRVPAVPAARAGARRAWAGLARGAHVARRGAPRTAWAPPCGLATQKVQGETQAGVGCWRRANVIPYTWSQGNGSKERYFPCI